MNVADMLRLVFLCLRACADVLISTCLHYNSQRPVVM
jgi:hypothetical protein